MATRRRGAVLAVVSISLAASVAMAMLGACGGGACSDADECPGWECDCNDGSLWTARDCSDAGECVRPDGPCAEICADRGGVARLAEAGDGGGGSEGEATAGGPDGSGPSGPGSGGAGGSGSEDCVDGALCARHDSSELTVRYICSGNFVGEGTLTMAATEDECPLSGFGTTTMAANMEFVDPNGANNASLSIYGLPNGLDFGLAQDETCSGFDPDVDVSGSVSFDAPLHAVDDPTDPYSGTQDAYDCFWVCTNCYSYHSATSDEVMLSFTGGFNCTSEDRTDPARARCEISGDFTFGGCRDEFAPVCRPEGTPVD